MAADNGFGHITVQWDYVPQRPLLGAMAAACESYGLTFGLWEANPTPGSGAQLLNDAHLIGAKADHYIAQAEEPKPWADIVSDFRAVYPELPAAVVTTFWGAGAVPPGTGDDGSNYRKADAEPIIDAGFKCLTEAYVVSNPNATPANLDWTARTHLGWPVTQPVIGVYGGYPAERYVTEQQLASWPGYWVWLAETMTRDDWAALREVNLA